MKKANYVAAVLSTIGFTFILVAMIMLDNNKTLMSKEKNNMSMMSASIARKTSVIDSSTSSTASQNIKKTSVVIPEERDIAEANTLRVEVFDGLTMEELAAKLNRNLGRDLLAGKGYLIASYSLSKGVDPYLATAIMLHETGCKTRCSQLVRTCNNVAGQKGSPNCNGSYKGYSSIDDGIRGAIDNLYKNFYARGLNTVSTIGPRYAQSPTWAAKINNYINMIKKN